MDLKSIIGAGKRAHIAAKAKMPGMNLSARFFVQFQNGTVYQYKTDSLGMAKLANINFNEVVMVQMASGVMKGIGRGSRFSPKVITMLEFKEVFEAPVFQEIEEDEKEDF